MVLLKHAYEFFVGLFEISEALVAKSDEIAGRANVAVDSLSA